MALLIVFASILVVAGLVGSVIADYYYSVSRNAKRDREAYHNWEFEMWEDKHG